MNHLRHQKYENKQLKNNTLELEDNFKPINISINNMDKFEKKELTKKRTFTKNIWYSWCNWYYIPEPIKILLAEVKTKLLVFLKPSITVSQNVSKPFQNYVI